MFKQKKPKKFNLQSRLQEREGESKSNFADRWNTTRQANTSRKKGMSLGMLFVILIILLLSMYWLDLKIT